MHALYPIPKRQRKIGAFPTADAMRAAKAASVTLDTAETPPKHLKPDNVKKTASNQTP
jgi:hypothetical protein